jgi:hypothetical protein
VNERTVSAAAIVAMLAAAAQPAGAAAHDVARARSAPACVVNDVVSSSHIRVVDPSLADALHEGLQRSPTLAALVGRIEASDGLLYVIGGPFRKANKGLTLRGGMSHEITIARPYRMLRITIQSGRGDGTIATIAHELRHALEVLDHAEVVDLNGVTRLYERIGIFVTTGLYETDAAQAAEWQVWRELAGCKR